MFYFKRFKATKPKAHVHSISWALIVLCELHPYMAIKRGGYLRQQRFVQKNPKKYMATKPGARDLWKLWKIVFSFEVVKVEAV